jgi:hypothetical protein
VPAYDYVQDDVETNCGHSLLFTKKWVSTIPPGARCRAPHRAPGKRKHPDGDIAQPSTGITDRTRNAPALVEREIDLSDLPLRQ